MFDKLATMSAAICSDATTVGTSKGISELDRTILRSYVHHCRNPRYGYSHWQGTQRSVFFYV